MLWLLLIPALPALVLLVLFAPYAIRYVVTLAQIQFLNVAYGLIIVCLDLERRARLVTYKWQRWRAYRNRRRMMRRAALEAVDDYQKNIRQIYRNKL